MSHMQKEFITIVNRRLAAARAMDEEEFLKRLYTLATLPNKFESIEDFMLDYIRRLRFCTDAIEAVKDYKLLADLAQQIKKWR